MNKLIEINQDYLIVCDNKECDFKIVNPTGEPNHDTSCYINMPCPRCGENLLTEKDYLTFLKVMKTFNWINKYFSWLTIFRFNKSKKCNEQNVYVHTHNGIHITDTKPQ